MKGFLSDSLRSLSGNVREWSFHVLMNCVTLSKYLFRRFRDIQTCPASWVCRADRKHARGVWGGGAFKCQVSMSRWAGRIRFRTMEVSVWNTHCEKRQKPCFIKNVLFERLASHKKYVFFFLIKILSFHLLLHFKIEQKKGILKYSCVNFGLRWSGLGGIFESYFEIQLCHGTWCYKYNSSYYWQSLYKSFFIPLGAWVDCTSPMLLCASHSCMPSCKTKITLSYWAWLYHDAWRFDSYKTGRRCYEDYSAGWGPSCVRVLDLMEFNNYSLVKQSNNPEF